MFPSYDALVYLPSLLFEYCTTDKEKSQMSHSVLIKHGWKVVFETRKLTVYELDNVQYVLWVSGKGVVIRNEK